jgi:hypothetical protein
MKARAEQFESGDAIIGYAGNRLLLPGSPRRRRSANRMAPTVACFFSTRRWLDGREIDLIIRKALKS